MNPKDHGECFVLDDGYDAPTVVFSPLLEHQLEKKTSVSQQIGFRVP